ncbi:glycosyltransferase family 2 protein [Spirosoma sp. KUDC1026]|uniref:glycosyltransferase family 2 protein n=1 Tax=Spirosoma sp. KUDC1026 TaxID=2745947 RepID=UPI00159BB7AE|nr:glycosyltransferase family 2 protein [Spirosoma sp. KUDC1026]QKZ11940.1 glycosyltransferase family 2 protein [Spirosoma sp. KUDC1026]
MLSSKVYIVVLNYNGWKDTTECIESLLSLKYSNYQIVIVDNCSSDDSAIYIERWLSKHRFIDSGLVESDFLQETKAHSCVVYSTSDLLNSFPVITFIQTNENLGYAGGNNVGIRYAQNSGDAAFVWILNNDTIVDPQSLGFLVQKIETSSPENVGLVGGKLMYYHDRERIQCIGGAYYNKWLGYSRQIGNGELENGQFVGKNVRPDLIIGACMLVSADFLQNVGLLNEEYFLYFEEQDWAERARQKGFVLSFSEKAIVYHKEGATIGAGQFSGSSRFSDFYFSRSKILFTDKYYNKLVSLSVRTSLLLTIYNRVRRSQYDRIPMLFKTMFSSREKLLNMAYKK